MVPGREGAWPGDRSAIAGIGVAGLVAALAVAYGQMRLRGASEPPASAVPVRVAVVQGNLDLGSQWRQELYGRNLDLYLRLTIQALRAESRPALVVWPESAMTFFLDDEPLYQQAIGRVLGAGPVELVAGGPRFEGDQDPVYYNSAFLIAPRGNIRARYDKEHLLPFAEYFPFAGLDFLRRSFGRVREFAPGGPTAPLPTVAGRAGVVICNEAMYPEIAARRVRAGAEYLINLSNDTWLNDRKFAEIAFDMVAMRAVEQRRYLVRASTSGPSAIVDPLGRAVVRSQSLSRDVIAGTVRPSSVRTVYSRVGDLFAFLCTGGAVAGLLRARRRQPRIR